MARARVMLAKRLASRGLAVSGGALAVAFSQGVASASAPAALVASTIKAANLTAAGQAVSVGLISTKVIALTEGVVKTMLLMKLKTAGAAIFVVLGMVALGGGLGQTEAARKDGEKIANSKADQPKVAAGQPKVAADQPKVAFPPKETPKAGTLSLLGKTLEALLKQPSPPPDRKSVV